MGSRTRSARTVSRDGQVLTTANHLGSVGGTETAQLAIFRALANVGWKVRVLYVSAGDLWAEWHRFASTTHVGATLPSRMSPLSSSVGTLQAVLAGIRGRPD